jgi:hypothetical protein
VTTDETPIEARGVVRESQLESVVARVGDLEARIAVLERHLQLTRTHERHTSDHMHELYFEAHGSAIRLVNPRSGDVLTTAVELCHEIHDRSGHCIATRIADLLNRNGV